MRIYLAARYDRQAEMREWREALVAAGHEVVSSWLDGPAPDAEDRLDDDVQARWAQVDMVDLRNADALITATEEPSVGYTTGGRHVELGLALAWGKRVYLVGPEENAFHHLPEVTQHHDLPELLGCGCLPDW